MLAGEYRIAKCGIAKYGLRSVRVQHKGLETKLSLDLALKPGERLLQRAHPHGTPGTRHV